MEDVGAEGTENNGISCCLPKSGSVLALCRDVCRTPRDGLVYLSNCLFSDPEDLARGSQAGDRCVSRPDLAGIKLS